MIETSVRELVVKKDYYGMDVFQFQGQMAVFCSERLANAFREENVVGAEISEGGWFHERRRYLPSEEFVLSLQDIWKVNKIK